ncbi:MAG: AAA family ATPase [Magnetococcales bacterium]|nr:AAA family ATPase [Magnetococcales bacterium]
MINKMIRSPGPRLHAFSPCVIGTEAKGNLFIDREAEFESLLAIIRAPDSDRPSIGMVTGPRRIGKTSLFLKILETLGKDDDGDFFLVYVDCRDANPAPDGCHSFEPIGRLVLGQILIAIERKADVLGRYTRAYAYSGSQTEKPETDTQIFLELFSVITRNHFPGLRAVIILDEFDEVVRLNPVWIDQITRLFRSPIPAQLPTGSRLILGLGWSLGGQMGEREAMLAKATERFADLSPFSQSDTTHALRTPMQDAYDWEPEALSAGWEAVQGYPLAVNCLVNAIHRQRYNDPESYRNPEYSRGTLWGWLGDLIRRPSTGPKPFKPVTAVEVRAVQSSAFQQAWIGAFVHPWNQLSRLQKGWAWALANLQTQDPKRDFFSDEISDKLQEAVAHYPIHKSRMVADLKRCDLVQGAINGMTTSQLVVKREHADAISYRLSIPLLAWYLSGLNLPDLLGFQLVEKEGLETRLTEVAAALRIETADEETWRQFKELQDDSRLSTPTYLQWITIAAEHRPDQALAAARELANNAPNAKHVSETYLTLLYRALLQAEKHGRMEEVANLQAELRERAWIVEVREVRLYLKNLAIRNLTRVLEEMPETSWREQLLQLQRTEPLLWPTIALRAYTAQLRIVESSQWFAERWQRRETLVRCFFPELLLAIDQEAQTANQRLTQISTQLEKMSQKRTRQDRPNNSTQIQELHNAKRDCLEWLKELQTHREHLYAETLHWLDVLSDPRHGADTGNFPARALMDVRDQLPPGANKEALNTLVRERLGKVLPSLLCNRPQEAEAAWRLKVMGTPADAIVKATKEFIDNLDETLLRTDNQDFNNFFNLFGVLCQLYKLVFEQIDTFAESDQESLGKLAVEQIRYLFENLTPISPDNQYATSDYRQAWNDWNVLLTGRERLWHPRPRMHPEGDAPGLQGGWRKNLCETLSKIRSDKFLQEPLTGTQQHIFEESALKEEDRQAARKAISNDLEIITPISWSLLPGFKLDSVRAYLVTTRGQQLTMRVYGLAGGSETSRGLLQSIWAAERRVLDHLSTRSSGKALIRLHQAAFSHDGRRLFLLSEHTKHGTLRSMLDQGRIGLLAPGNRKHLWRHLGYVLTAVANMHQRYFLHRFIRPDSIFISGGSEIEKSNPLLKLGFFEMSLYLHAAVNCQAEQMALPVDYYVAPEALRSWREESERVRGEGFGVDIYGLGLVLFECLVRRLDSGERHEATSLGHYSYDDHKRWVTRRHEEVQNAVDAGDLTANEADVIKSMLVFDHTQRVSDLDPVLEQVRRFARFDGDLVAEFNDKPPLGFLNLNPDHAYNILNVLHKAHPELRPTEHLSPDAVRNHWLNIIMAQLKNALVFKDSASTPQKPAILLQGTKCLFRAEPYTTGVGNSQTSRHDFAYITLAFISHRPVGEPLMKLTGGVALRGFDPSVIPELRGEDNQSWKPLFELVQHEENELNPAQLRFWKLLGLTADLEKELQESFIIDCDVEALPNQDGFRRIRIKQNMLRSSERKVGEQDLLDMVERNRSHSDNRFIFSHSQDPMRFHDREAYSWYVENLEKDAVILRQQLVGEGPSLGRQGFLRPVSVELMQPLFQRRQRVLQDIYQDPYLLESVLVRHHIKSPRLGVIAREPFIKPLDKAKKDLVQSCLDQRPIFCVQGPPGTGKTTFAAELVLQVLAENPSARILVTSQGHDPLNNLLERIENALPDFTANQEVAWAGFQKPIRVRLAHAQRSEASELLQKFSPEEQARACLEKARNWRPNQLSQRRQVADEDILQAWAEWVNTELKEGVSAHFVDAFVQSANLVYATSNDNRLDSLSDQNFDLVIFEEAARGHPLELLGTMRMARWWVLIGDHHQLPPFGIKEMFALLERRKEAFLRQQTAAAYGLTPERDAQEASSFPLELLAGTSAASANRDDDSTYSTVGELVDDTRYWLRLFERAYENNAVLRPRRAGMLDTQWRMHSTIGTLVSQAFYQGKLQNPPLDELESFDAKKRHDMPAGSRYRFWPGTVVWLDIPRIDDTELSESDRLNMGEKAAKGGGYVNRYECRVLHDFLSAQLGFLRLGGYRHQSRKMVIIAPYRAQVSMFRQHFANWDNPFTGPLGKRVFTVDSFQGRQADIVAVSLTRNNSSDGGINQRLGFLQDPSRATVMLSRAERLLIVVGCSRQINPGATKGRWTQKRLPDLPGDAADAENQLWRFFQLCYEMDAVIDARDVVRSYH